MMSQPLQRTSRRRAQRLAAAQNRKHQEMQQQRKYQQYSNAINGDDSSPSPSATASASVSISGSTSATTSNSKAKAKTRTKTLGMGTGAGMTRPRSRAPSPSISAAKSKSLAPINTANLSTSSSPALVSPLGSTSPRSGHSDIRSVTPTATSMAASSLSAKPASSEPSWEDYDAVMFRQPRNLPNSSASAFTTATPSATPSANGIDEYEVGATYRGRLGSKPQPIPLDEYGGDPSLRSVTAKNAVATRSQTNLIQSHSTDYTDPMSNRSSYRNTNAAGTDVGTGVSSNGSPLGMRVASKSGRNLTMGATPNTSNIGNTRGSASNSNSRSTSPVPPSHASSGVANKYGTNAAAGPFSSTAASVSSLTNASAATAQPYMSSTRGTMSDIERQHLSQTDAYQRRNTASSMSSVTSVSSAGLVAMIQALQQAQQKQANAIIRSNINIDSNAETSSTTSTTSSIMAKLPPPKNLTPDELTLWNTFQTTLEKNQDTNTRIVELKQIIADKDIELELRQKLPSDTATISQLEEQMKQAEERHTQEKQEYTQSLRAIQRVMADLTAEKEQDQEEFENKMRHLEEKYKKQMEKASSALSPPPPPPPPAPSLPSSASTTSPASSSSPSGASPPRPRTASLTSRSSPPPRSPSSVAPVTSHDEKLASRIAQLKAELMEAKKKQNAYLDEKAAMKRDFDKKSRRVTNLERDLKTQRFHHKKHVEEITKLKSQISQLESKAAEESPSSSSPPAKTARGTDRETMKLRTEVVRQSKRVESLRNENSNLKAQLEKSVEQMEAAVADAAAASAAAVASAAVANDRSMPTPGGSNAATHGATNSTGSSNDEKDAITREKNEQIQSLTRELNDAKRDLDETKLDLDQTVASLENAKMIITSLETANSSLSNDLRGKLKAKEEELTYARQESTDRKHRLDTLATELRDLQMQHDSMKNSQIAKKNLYAQQKALIRRLESNVTDLQSAAVVHEVSVSTGAMDSGNANHVSEILGSTLKALQTIVKQSTEDVSQLSREEQQQPMQSQPSGNLSDDESVSSEIGRQVDNMIRSDREAAAKELRRENDEYRTKITSLQAALKESDTTIELMRKELSNVGQNEELEIHVLRAEVQSLQTQCATNMSILAKKERELSVLKSSLRIDDDDGGYISDDASDEEDEDLSSLVPPGSVVSSPSRLDGYGAKETEALATILAAQEGMPAGYMMQQSSPSPQQEEPQGPSAEVEALKKDVTKLASEREGVQKELQRERESLANAKMIISSLEKANKSMMEDLRSRLQDSNTAIASLLDKGMEHETTTNSLRAELEAMKQEKERIAQEYQEKERVAQEYEEKMQALKEQNKLLASQSNETGPSVSTDVTGPTTVMESSTAEDHVTGPISEEKKEETVGADA